MKQPKNSFAKECIGDAFFELIKEKSFAEITVVEICRRAGYNRVTYYRNFDSKEDIVRQRLNELVDEFKGTMRLHRGKNFAPTAARMFEHIQKNKELFLTLRKANLEQFSMQAIERAFHIPAPYTALEKAAYHDKMSYYKNFHAGGYWNVISNWLADGMQETPEEMGNILAEIVENSTIY